MRDQKFISELFLENSQFILVGLTGRTGSGCTTTANILEEKNQISLKLITSQDFIVALMSTGMKLQKNSQRKTGIVFTRLKLAI